MNPTYTEHENQKTQQSQSPIESAPQPQQQQQHSTRHEGTETAAASSSTSITSSIPHKHKHSKLDGVLYHFYSKTLAVITSSRLTHYDTTTHDTNQSTSTTPLSDTSSATSRANAATSSSTGRRANKWFELDIADYGIFREEVKLWRAISTMIPASVLDRPPTTSLSASETSYIPAMVLDIILDTSSLGEKHILMMEQSDVGPMRRKRRVRVDGKDTSLSSGKLKEDQNTEGRDLRPIVLESWRLEVGVCNPVDPPDLPILYRRMTALLKELFALSKQLPISPLFSKIQSGKQKSRREASSEADLLKMGVRLRVDRSDEEEAEDDDICGLREPLGPLNSSSDDNNPKVTEIYTFQPITTAIGTLQCMVEYRVDADFYIEEVDPALSMKDLELDEDYFRPNQGQIKSQAKGRSTLQQSPLSGSPSSHQEDSSNSNSITTPQSTSDRRQNLVASEGVASMSGSGKGSNPSPPSEMIPRSPGPASTTTSVFSASTSSGKPVAGLSSLRRSPSISGHGTSPTTAMTAIGGANASSPGTTPALVSDAAFLTHGRRTSTSERRLRTIASLGASADKSSPPTSAAPTPPSPGYHPSSRPILARASVNTLPSLRSGSFSPSSPSPLAQQMSAQRPAVASQSNSRLSSSPSYRTASLPLSASPNLRSVFQMSNPSHSQTSISSLSRTPPKYITEGSSAATNSSSLGLHSNSVAQSSPSQSSLVEGRQPSVAPQMIKRYSSTFNYRQGRQSSTGGIPGSSLESEGGSSSAPYSKSWQARIEQRQMFTARSLGREDGLHLSAGSGQGGGAFFTGSYSPRAQKQSLASTSQEDDLDDFVRMIDSNQPGEGSSSSTGQTGASHSAEGAAFRRSPLPNRTIASSGIGFTRHGGGWNRNQVDEMLNKMQSSVREFSTSSTSRGSGNSAGAATTPSSGGSGPSGAGLESPNVAGGQSVSPSFVRSPLSRVGFSASSGTSGGVDMPSKDEGGLSRRTLPPPPYRYAGRERPDGNLTSSDVREEAEGEEIEDERDGTQRSSRRQASRASLELQPHSYDPLEDEAVGRLELMQDDSNSHGNEALGMQPSRHRPSESMTSEAAERRRADLEMARNFGQVVSSSSSRGTSRASLSPWRNRISSNRGGNGGPNNT
jgi:autophagy-related protein 13